MSAPHILVIGGGLAGHTTAYRLISRGYRVSIVDQGSLSRPSLSSTEALAHPKPLTHDVFPPPTDSANALPVILQGFQEATWSLLNELHPGWEHFRKGSHRLEFVGPSGTIIPFRFFPAPSPLHTVLGILRFPLLSLKDRWKLLNNLEKIWEGASDLPQSPQAPNADRWLEDMGQSFRARRQVWNPLCQFLLGASVDNSSAMLFGEIIRLAFLSSRRRSRMTLPIADEASLLIGPLQRRLSERGARLIPFHRVTGFHDLGEKIEAVSLEDGTQITADAYVSALPPRSLLACLPERLLTKYSYFYNLMDLDESPLVVVHLHVAYPTTASKLVLASKAFHWILSHPIAGSSPATTRFSCVAAGNGDLLTHSDDQLIQIAMEEALGTVNLGRASHPGMFLAGQVIRRPRAYLYPRQDMAGLRPIQRSPLSNLYLAGPWTDTGFPPLRESSVVSGNLCADAVITGVSSPHIDNVEQAP